MPSVVAEVTLAKLCERLRLMSNEELVKFGKMVRGLSEPRVSVMPDQIARDGCAPSQGLPSRTFKTSSTLQPPCR